MENASFVGEGRTGATSDSPARNGIRRSRYWLSDFLVRRVLAHRCTSQRIWFTRFKQGPQAHRPLRFIWKNTFDPWAAPSFREAQIMEFISLLNHYVTPNYGSKHVASRIFWMY